MKIALAYHFDENNPPIWSTPSGLGISFRKKGHFVQEYGFDPQNCNLEKLIDETNKYDLIFFCLAGPSESFDRELKKLKNSTKTKIFMETGDDVPWSNYHHTRVHYLDVIFTPDLRCNVQYIIKGLRSYWLPCWCDDEIFYYKPQNTRQNKIVTTCGDRPGTQILSQIYGNNFVNSKVWNYENTDYFNSGTIVYQYARYGEITRRLFETGGCKNAILTNRIGADTGIYKLFVDNEDICYFSDEKELIEKADKLYNDEEFRNKISENMYNKIQKYHLISNRVDSILNVYNNLT